MAIAAKRQALQLFLNISTEKSEYVNNLFLCMENRRRNKDRSLGNMFFKEYKVKKLKENKKTPKVMH